MSPRCAPNRAEFEALLPTLEQLRGVLMEAIRAEADARQLRLAVPLESRVKTWESTLGKFERGIGGVAHFRDFQDLVGIRVVVPFSQDIASARRVVGAACRVINGYDTSDRLDDDRFGYSASHFVVRPRPTVESLQNFASLVAEVQIRTAAQHIWAQASHMLQYKTSEAVPPELRRSIHRVAALLELVDLEFDRLLSARESYRRSIQMADDALPLDVDVLAVALPQLWPAEHPSSPGVYAVLLDALQRHGVRTLGELRRLVVTQRSAVFADSLAKAQELVYAVTHGTKQGNSFTITEGNSSRSYCNVSSELIERSRRGIFYSLSALTFTALQFASNESNALGATKA